MDNGWRVVVYCEKGHRGELAFDHLGYLRDPGPCPTCQETASVASIPRHLKRDLRRFRRQLKNL